LRTAQRIGKIGSWEVDILQQRTTWSDETYRIFEKDPATFVVAETTYLDSIHPEDRPAIREALAATVKRGLSFRAQHRIVLERGVVKHVEVMGEVTHGRDGTPVRVVGSIQDITESKLAEEALSDKVHRLQLLRDLGILFSGSLNQLEIVEKVSAFIPHHLGVSQVLIRFVDAEGRLLIPRASGDRAVSDTVPYAGVAETNISVACIEQKRPMVVNDCRTSPLIPIEWREQFGVRSVLVVPIRTQQSILGVLRVDDFEHYDRFTDADVEFVALVADQLAVAIVNARLYTAAKNAEEAKERLNAELERRVKDRTSQLEAVNKELESFSYSVSHDLRAPLRHISGFVELLRGRSNEALDSESQRYLATISQSAVRLGNLIDELLSFSRIGRTDLRTGPVELAALLQEVRRDMEQDLKGRTIDWRIGELPRVMGDATLLKLVLTNLLSNAVKFSRYRDVAVIEVGTLPQDGSSAFHTFFVRDNGAGFDQEYAPKLFGVFQRLHTSEEFEGTGIGLANVRRIVQRHGGATWAEGVVEGGATIYFTLPAVTGI
jgi:signal transduction histidine kinase